MAPYDHPEQKQALNLLMSTLTFKESLSDKLLQVNRLD